MFQTYKQFLKYGIDLGGLDNADVERIGKVGLDAWMDEQANKPVQLTVKGDVNDFAKRCSLGSQCAFAKKKKPSFCKGKDKYCSKFCKDRAVILKKKKKADWEAKNPGMAGIRAKTGRSTDSDVLGPA